MVVKVLGDVSMTDNFLTKKRSDEVDNDASPLPAHGRYPSPLPPTERVSTTHDHFAS